MTRAAWLVCLLAGAPLPPVSAGQSQGPVSAPPPPPPALEAAGTEVRPQPRVSWPLDRYLCFSNLAQVPAIRVSEAAHVVRVGQSATLPLEGLASLSDVRAKAVAGELGVPTGLIVKTARAASQSQASPPDFARQLRSAVIDFRFLLAELTCYHPAGDASARTNALLELLDGDLPEVWEFYRSLPWPRAPASPMRVVKAP